MSQCINYLARTKKKIKAFDTEDHAVLLDKLSNLGIVDKEHGWFTDYLSNRTQVVEFQGVTSTPEAISVGGSQGSILGPLHLSRSSF